MAERTMGEGRLTFQHIENRMRGYLQHPPEQNVEIGLMMSTNIPEFAPVPEITHDPDRTDDISSNEEIGKDTLDRILEWFMESLTARDKTIAELRAALADQKRIISQLEMNAVEPEPVSTLPFFHASVRDAWPYPGADAELARFLEKRSWTSDEDEVEGIYHSIQLLLRGSQELIRERQAWYLPLLDIPEQHRDLPILDIGCGRGEFLELVRGRGDRVVGVDLDASEIKRLQQQGYEAHHADGADYLSSLPPNSLVGVTAFQVIEHVSHDYLRKLLKLAYSRLVSGGWILLETVNPDCDAAFRSFYLDPTHRRPIPKWLLSILLAFYDFTSLEVLYQSPLPRDAPVSDHDWSKYYQTYAILGRK
jgi:SAM-dependent methyltransferase